MPEAGIEPAQVKYPRDFKSLASTNSAIRAAAQKRKYIEKSSLSKEKCEIFKKVPIKSAVRPVFAMNRIFMQYAFLLYFFGLL